MNINTQGPINPYRDGLRPPQLGDLSPDIGDEKESGSEIRIKDLTKNIKVLSKGPLPSELKRVAEVLENEKMRVIVIAQFVAGILKHIKTINRRSNGKT